MQALGVFERCVLRTISSGSRRCMAAKNKPTTSSPNSTVNSISGCGKPGRIQWTGQVARMPASSPAKMLFAFVPAGTRMQLAQRADQIQNDIANGGATVVRY